MESISMNISIRLLFTIIVAGTICSCGQEGASDSQPKLANTLHSDFSAMYMAAHGRDFPSSKAKLADCKKANNAACLDVFGSVQAASESLRAIRSIETLRESLAIIESSCLSKNEEIANYVCYGGIISLYFFNDVAEDELILKTVENYPKTIRNIIFNNSFAWQENRPDEQLWINYIDSADIDWKTNDTKSVTTELFSKKDSWHYWPVVISKP